MNKHLLKVASVFALLISIVNGEVQGSAISAYYSMVLFFAHQANQTFVYFKHTFSYNLIQAISILLPNNTAVIHK